MGSFCYHGIGENLLKYESIMKNGILSTQMAKNIDTYNKNGGINHNGNDRISVALPHDISQWGALNLYILGSGIAFKVQDCQYTLASTTNNSSEYFDEAFIDGQIPVGNISGIIVNSEMRTKKISELSAIGSPANNEVINITQNIMKQLKAQGIRQETFSEVYELLDKYVTISNNTSFDFLEQDKQLIPIRKEIDSILSLSIEELYKQKLGKEDINVLDVIKLYNDRNLPIYDENDIIRECNGEIINENSEYMKQEKSLTVIPEKKQITSWFKEKWEFIKEIFSNDRNNRKKPNEEIQPNNSNRSTANRLKNLVVDNKNNQIEKRAMEEIKKKEQFEIIKTLTPKNSIETDSERN